MRDEKLREQISSWKSKWKEANEKIRRYKYKNK